MVPVVSGTLLLELITAAVFFLIGRFSLGVVLGALWGTAVMTVYYLLMALSVTKAASGDPDKAKKKIMSSYSARMLFLLVFMGAGIYVSENFGIINYIPMLLAVIFPRIAIAVWQLVFKTKKMMSDEKEGDKTP